MSYPAPAPPFIQARWYSTRSNKPIKRIVIHGAVTPCRRGAARALALYFARTDRAASAHYNVDPAEVYQSVYDSHVAYHDGTNDKSLAVEMADEVEGPLSRWKDTPHRRTLRGTARLTAELCLAYDVPARWLGPVRARLGRKGITTHNVMRLAFPGSTTHWDPGKWPRRRFMRLVHQEIEAIKAEVEGSEPPKPTRVSRARDLIADALDLLAAVPPRRRRVHAIDDDLRDLLDQLPER